MVVSRNIRFGVIDDDGIRKAAVIGNLWLPGIDALEKSPRIECSDDLDSLCPLTGAYENIACGTCNRTMNEGCDGHMCHIKLPHIKSGETSYIPNVMYLGTLCGVLNSFCPSCVKLIIPDDKLATYQNSCTSDKLIGLKDFLEKLTVCPCCRTKIVKRYIVFDSDLYTVDVSDKITKGSKKTLVDVNDKVKNVLTMLLGNIDELEKLGIRCSPMGYLMSCIPVLPSAFSRSPSDQQKKRPNPLMSLYVSILTKVKDCDDSSDDVKLNHVSNKLHEIYNEYKKYILALTPKQKKMTIQYANYRKFVDKKEGFYQSDILCKRNRRNARTVILPDSNLEVDQIGVPDVIASSITVKRVVTKYNKNQIVEWIKSGTVVKSIKTGNRRIKISNISDREVLIQIAEKISIGDLIERRVIDGDLMMFNRQPTLHKSSVMVFRVVVYYDTLCCYVNPSVLEAFNADFDGDEMNMWFPQHCTTMLESFLCMRVAKHQIGDKGNVQIGPMADNIVGCWRLSRPPFLVLPVEGSTRDNEVLPVEEVSVSAEDWNDAIEDYKEEYIDNPLDSKIYQLNLIQYMDWMQIIYNAKREGWIKSVFQRANLHGYNFNLTIERVDSKTKEIVIHDNFRHHIPGRLLLSFAFPPELHFEYLDEMNDNKVKIEDGILIEGRITAKVLYKANRSIKRMIIDAKGEDYGLVFDKIIQDIVKGYHMYISPYTLDIDGVTPGGILGYKYVAEEIQEFIDEVQIKAEGYMKDYISLKGYEAIIAELRINKLFGAARAKIADILTSSINKELGIGVMMFSGAKGEPGQLIDAYGAMCLQGISIPKAVHGMGVKPRTSFFSYADSTSIDDYGFIFSNMFKGLNTIEVLFGSIKARKDLINTSNVTPITGAAEKDLFKHMNNTRVHPDGTVRDTNNMMIREQIGSLGFDIQTGVPGMKSSSDTQYANINSISLIRGGQKRYRELVKKKIVDHVEDIPSWTVEFLRDINEEIEVYLSNKKRKASLMK